MENTKNEGATGKTCSYPSFSCGLPAERETCLTVFVLGGWHCVDLVFERLYVDGHEFDLQIQPGAFAIGCGV